MSLFGSLKTSTVRALRFLAGKDGETITKNPAIMCPASHNGPKFARAPQSDGTVTSICNLCRLTIARAADARDLPDFEFRHICQPAERRQSVRIAHQTHIPPTRSSWRLGDSGSGILIEGRFRLSESAKIELIQTHLFVHPCYRCEKSSQPWNPDDERVCFSCQFSLKRRWSELASIAPLPPKIVGFNHSHEMQLYSSEDLFLDRFTRFMGAALEAGKAVVVVATKVHRDALFQRLLANGFDVTDAIDQGRYIPLDVADVLATFMVNDFPDPIQFWRTTSALLAAAKDAARGKRPRVAACGECAPVLWQEGMADAAVRLEGLWDELAMKDDLDILCGYPGESFRCEQGPTTFQRILAEHSAVHAW
jgi:hypothetical protein